MTKPDEIEAAFSKAKAAFGHIDVVFNNAGILVVAEIEGIPDDKARGLFEVQHYSHLFSMSFSLTLLREGPIFRRCQRFQDRCEVFPREFTHRRTPHTELIRRLLPSSCRGRILCRHVGLHLYCDLNCQLIICRRKGALESFTEALAKELDPAWNMKVSVGLIKSSRLI